MTERTDAQRYAAMRIKQEVARWRDRLFAASWERMVLLAALTRLGSGEAFEISRALSFPMDNELRARMAYADEIASGYCTSQAADTHE